MFNKSIAILFTALLIPVLAACAGSAPASTTELATGQAATSVPLDTLVPGETEVMESGDEQHNGIVTLATGDENNAPKIRDIESWINSEPITIEDQRGKVVLVDFWTYTCVNCIRTLPFLKAWYEKYQDHGLVIIGMHAPEFEFEKVRDSVVQATEEFGITWPVTQDNKMGTWRAFDNRFWPAKYLIDGEGKFRYTHFGEGSYEEKELWIRSLLVEAGADLSDVSPETDAEPIHSSAAEVAEPGQGLTRELYAGYDRNQGARLSRQSPPYVTQRVYYDNRGDEYQYEDPGDHQNHFLYIQGLWRNDEERLIHARKTIGFQDYLATKFFATSVNAVMGPGEGLPLKVQVLLDDLPITPDNAGVDVMFDGNEGPYILVDDWRMYNIVSLPEFEDHILKLSSNSPEFSMFAYTFGAYEVGEPAQTGPNG